MSTTIKRHRGFNVEIWLVPEQDGDEAGYYSWRCKKEDGTVIAEPDGQYSFVGEDGAEAFENAKQAINDFLEN